jgi:hypothetical protein
VARLPAPRALLARRAADARGGHPMPRQRAWVTWHEAGLRATVADLDAGRTGRADRFRLERLASDSGGWPAVVVDARPCRAPGGTCAASGARCLHPTLWAPRRCARADCPAADAPLVVSRTPTVVDGLLCGGCRRMPTDGSPVFPVEHLDATQPHAWAAWRAARRPDLPPGNGR